MKDSENSGSINSSHGSLHYVKYGNGSKTLVIFHGFGQDHKIAAPFYDHLSEGHTIYSFDLPYHGKSNWQEERIILSKNEIRSMFAKWLTKNEIDIFAVIGYSMGGKFAIALAEEFRANVNQLILIASDGLHKSPWYRLAMLWPVDFLFRRIIDKPNFYFWFTKSLSKTSLTSDKLIQFAESQMATRQLRAMVYYTWHNFQELFVAEKKLKRHISEGQLRATLIVGNKDSIIKPNNVVPIARPLGFEIKLVDAGHAKVLELAAKDIVNILS